MAEIFCTACGKRAELRWAFCRSCGAALDGSSSDQRPAVADHDSDGERLTRKPYYFAFYAALAIGAIYWLLGPVHTYSNGQRFECGSWGAPNQSNEVFCNEAMNLQIVNALLVAVTWWVIISLVIVVFRYARKALRGF